MRQREAALPEIQVVTARVESIRSGYPSGVDVRPGWVSRPEWLEAEILTDVSRRWQWLAGRYSAKALLAPILSAGRTPEVDWDRIVIRSRDCSGRSVAPLIWFDGLQQQGRLSLSHTSAMAAAAFSSNSPLGIDLVTLPEPIQQASSSRQIAPLVRWCLVEAAFKTGLAGGPFKPFRWSVFRSSDQDSYSIQAPTRLKLRGHLQALGKTLLATSWLPQPESGS